MKPKLSKASKMPCYSFSLPVNDEVCKGRYDKQGKMKSVCSKCYANKGFYNMPNAIKLREHNLISSKSLFFATEMIKLIKDKKYFRWFDSGDIYSDKFLYKVYMVCRESPDTFHWIPTKTRNLFNQIIWKKLEALTNVKVRFSSDSIDGQYIKGLHGSTVIQKESLFPVNKAEVFTCKAPKQMGECRNCRACWHNEKVIAYEIH